MNIPIRAKTRFTRFISFVLCAMILAHPLAMAQHSVLPPLYQDDITPGVWNSAKELPGIKVDFLSAGNASARQIQMIFFFDPNCPHDAKLWNTLYGKEGIGKNVVSYWVPVSYIRKNSYGKVLWLLRKNSVEALAHNFEFFNFSKTQGAATISDESPTASLRQRLKDSLQLLDKLGVGTPLFLYRDKQGRIVKRNALPSAQYSKELSEHISRLSSPTLEPYQDDPL